MRLVPLTQEERRVRRLLDRFVYVVLIAVLVPTLLLFELVVLRDVVAVNGSTAYTAHLCLVCYLVHNVVGNLVLGFFTNTSVERRIVAYQGTTDWSVCLDCDATQAPRTLHCKICNLCILKRDHHCFYFASCINYHNYRYFFFFVLHLFVSMLYALVYNLIFLYSAICWNRTTVVKALLPLVCILFDETPESFYLSMAAVNLVVLGVCAALLGGHVPAVLGGRSCREGKGGRNDRGWARNATDALGTRWAAAWLSPLVPSPMPGDGTEWPE